MSATTARRAPTPRQLGDFTVTPRVLLISGLAAIVGLVSSLVALALVRLIALVTNLVFFGHAGGTLPVIEHTTLPWWARVSLPVAGGLVVGLMARYGSERIRGHGMPETIEVVLTGGSKVAPRVAVLKPLSAAISIGTGGPFGAEGPIIMTGGAVGSIIAQLLDLTADERKTLLVSGATAGMAAIFNTPIAAVLLAVELLLFELRPRSVVPVSVAVAASTVLRYTLFGRGALFPVRAFPVPHSVLVYLAAVGLGAAAAVLGVGLSQLVYASEDAFGRLPFHWMWWPPIGGLVIGVGGLFSVRALGVGYSTIGDVTASKIAVSTLVAAFVVKSLIWSLSLGSGTSGGVVAPILFIGATGGALAATFLPTVAVGFWPAVAIAALLGSSLQVPLTGVVFALEVTHAYTGAVPMLLAASVAYVGAVLMTKRSILTEKVARKGFHVSREYDVDPLEVLLVREVLDDGVVTIAQDSSLQDAVGAFLTARGQRAEDDTSDAAYRQRLYPVVDDEDRLLGAVTRSALVGAALAGTGDSLDEHVITDISTCTPDETLRTVANRMADRGVSRLVVLEGEEVVGVIALSQTLAARLRDLDEGRVSERILRPHIALVRRVGGRTPATTARSIRREAPDADPRPDLNPGDSRRS
jgi:CIC family chloride channel protein